MLSNKGVFTPNKRLDPIWNTTIEKYKLNQEEELKKEVKTLFDTWDTSKAEQEQQKKEKTKPKRKLGPIYFGIN